MKCLPMLLAWIPSWKIPKTAERRRWRGLPSQIEPTQVDIDHQLYPTQLGAQGTAPRPCFQVRRAPSGCPYSGTISQRGPIAISVHKRMGEQELARIEETARTASGDKNQKGHVANGGGSDQPPVARLQN